ncbi:hypothetical protein WISP_79590 [Willisornis vidua]|uniref:Uncharacterized protein n=1 Tax=Willisornis vidua TaxID=1566151 RepID=A0ABQ9DAH6_9PASS|nr:hypothetical protein WISP_79590 [Willisornis vidua]
MVMRTQLRCAGHISRMEDHFLPKIVLCGELTTSCRKRGAPKRRQKYPLKQHLSLGHTDCRQWSTLASSWDSWRHTIHDDVAFFENAQTRLAYPTLAFLTTSTLAASVRCAIPKSLFMKPSHDDDDDDDLL